jgi:hypothetical protein
MCTNNVTIFHFYNSVAPIGKIRVASIALADQAGGPLRSVMTSAPLTTVLGCP